MDGLSIRAESSIFGVETYRIVDRCGRWVSSGLTLQTVWFDGRQDYRPDYRFFLSKGAAERELARIREAMTR